MSILFFLVCVTACNSLHTILGHLSEKVRFISQNVPFKFDYHSRSKVLTQLQRIKINFWFFTTYNKIKILMNQLIDCI